MTSLIPLEFAFNGFQGSANSFYGIPQFVGRDAELLAPVIEFIFQPQKDILLNIQRILLVAGHTVSRPIDYLPVFREKLLELLLVHAALLDGGCFFHLSSPIRCRRPPICYRSRKKRSEHGAPTTRLNVYPCTMRMICLNRQAAVRSQNGICHLKIYRVPPKCYVHPRYLSAEWK